MWQLHDTRSTFLGVFVLELAGVEQKESNNYANEMINGDVYLGQLEKIFFVT